MRVVREEIAPGNGAGVAWNLRPLQPGCGGGGGEAMAGDAGGGAARHRYNAPPARVRAGPEPFNIEYPRQNKAYGPPNRVARCWCSARGQRFTEEGGSNCLT
jgi:hypothetical protein